MTSTATRHTGILLGRCNPYGAETGGPQRVLGGLYGPQSATTPDAGLPENVAQGEWACSRVAEVRCRMWCRCGHKGQVMELCSWHDEITYRGELSGGTIRQVRHTIRSHGHFEEIQKRQADLCPACAFPPPYGELMREILGWQQERYWLPPRNPRYQALLTQEIDAGKLMDDARAQGIIHNCPLTLRAIS